MHSFESRRIQKLQQELLRSDPSSDEWVACVDQRLLKREFDIDLQRCPRCGPGELKIIAAIL
jgi:uncharacterized protein with PIN domain